MSDLLDDYITEDECAKALRRHTRTLHRWRDAREGPPFIRLHGRILYRRQSVADWLLSLEQGSAA